MGFIASVIAALMGRKTPSAESSLRSAHKFGLIGNWAQDCSTPSWNGNWHITYSTNTDGQIIRHMKRGPEERFSVIHAIKEIETNRLLVHETYDEGWGEFIGIDKSYVLEFSEGYKSYRSIKSEFAGNQSFIEDGKILATDRESTVLYKCSSGS